MIFLHELQWDNDVYIMYIAWLLLFPLILYVIRYLYGKFRPVKLSYKWKKYYMVRDLFLNIVGLEYLIIVSILFSIYLGIWAWKVNPASITWEWPWENAVPYLIILPQLLAAVLIIVLFYMRYVKFRKPLIRS